MFAGAIVVSPLLALGADEPAAPMVTVASLGALAALQFTVVFARGDRDLASR
jgi:hypothetical protein